MLLVYDDLLDEGVLLFVTFFGAVLTALLAGITFHEFSHAFVADRLGDRTARALGRVSLNPIRHLEPFGTLMMMIIGFGWGKPVPVNPARLRNGPQAGRAMVAGAGPLANLLLAAIASIPIHAGLADWHSPFVIFGTRGWGFADYLGLFLASLIIFNVGLAIFNLLPIAPLDGFAVAMGFMPREMAISFSRLEQYGPVILMVLFFLPFLTGGQVNLIRDIMSPFVNGLTELFSGSDPRAFR